jgi:hypothetical protein
MNIGNFRQIIFVFCLLINAIELDAQSSSSNDATAGGASQKINSDTVNAQTRPVSFPKMKTKWEFSTNVTLALSRFTGNVSRNLNDDPYLIMVRKVDTDQGAAWRMGLNGFRTSSQSNFPDRVSSENWASLVLGREWRTELQQGAFIYGGIDSRGIFRQSHSEEPNSMIWATRSLLLLMLRSTEEVLEEFVGLDGDFKIESQSIQKRY